MDEKQMARIEQLNRRAFYGLLVTAVFMLLVWLLLAVFSDTSGFDPNRDINLALLFTVSLIGAALAKNGQARLGIWLIITVIYLICLVAILLSYENLGVTVSILALLVSGGLASFGLRQQDINRTVVATFIGSLLIILADTLSPFERSPYPSVTSLSIVAVIAVALYGYFIYRQFRNYTLQIKLTIVIITITVLSIGAISLTVSLVIEESLTKQVTDSLTLRVEKLSDFMGSIFLQKVGQMQAVAAVDSIKTALEERNQAYRGDEAAIVAEIQAVDEQWVAASDDDPLIQSVSTKDEDLNPTAFQLYDFLEIFPEQSEIFVTDKYGATVGATGRLSDYYQADEEWWQAAWNDGQGAIYISDPVYDESADVVAVNIAVPISSEESGQLLGIVRSTLILDVFFDAIADQQLEETGHGLLLTRDGEVLFEGLVVGEGGGSQNLPPSLRQDMARVASPEFMIGLDEHGDESIFAFAPAHVEGFGEHEVAGADDEGLSEFETAVSEAVSALGWAVVLRQESDEAFAAIARVSDVIQLVSIVSVLVAAILAGFFARTVIQPIRALGEAAAQIGSGNLGVTLPLAGDDEVGELTAQFASMAERLQQTVGELQQRTLVIETSSEVSRHLSTILNEQELLNTVVNQVKRGFNYYHAHIYLLNERGDRLVMAAGTGQAAQEMLAQRHGLRLGEGLVGQAAQAKEVVLVSDVRQDPNWVSNSLLPATKAEVAVPIVMGKQVLGVLDVQHNLVNGLQERDADLLQLLANQIAIALQNARLFTQTQQQATQQSLINEIGRKIQTAPTVERVLQIAAEELGQALGTQRTTIQLNSREQQNGR